MRLPAWQLLLNLSADVVGRCVSAVDFAKWAEAYRPTREDQETEEAVRFTFCQDCSLSYFIAMQGAGRCYRDPSFAKTARLREHTLERRTRVTRTVRPRWLPRVVA